MLNQRSAKAYALAALLACLSLSANANTDGIYVMDGGGYSMNIEFSPGMITLIEPNKTSQYLQNSGSNEYLFTNPTNNIRYGLRVLDDSTIQAFKPGSSDAPTTLRLQSPGLAFGSTDAASDDAILNKYMSLAESDPTNVQTWSQCALVAMTRALGNAAEADTIALQSATALKMISVNTVTSPCPDAISEAIWDRAEEF